MGSFGTALILFLAVTLGLWWWRGGETRAPRPRFALLFLLWPLANMWYLQTVSEGAETTTSLLGFGLSHLGYLMLAAGLFLGQFAIFGLRSRARTLLAGLVVLTIGVVLVNV